MEYAKDALSRMYQHMLGFQVFLETLVELREMAPDVPYQTVGICENWIYLLGRKNCHESALVINLVGELAQSWPHTWAPDFPTWIPIRNPQSLPLWKDEQLELRLSLMDHILACLRDYQAQQETPDV